MSETSKLGNNKEACKINTNLNDVTAQQNIRVSNFCVSFEKIKNNIKIVCNAKFFANKIY
jgi:hypothetical protein